MKNSLVITIVLVLIVGVGAFFGGMKYQQSKDRSSITRQAFNGLGGGNGGQGRNRIGGGRQVIGEVISQDDKSITVKLQDGSSKIILLSTNTTINKASEGVISDLKVGERVGIFGSDNSDGSVTAQNIQLNPMFRGGPGGGTGIPAGGGTPR